VLAGCGSLHEVESLWSIDDLYDSHEALDVQAEAQEHAMGGSR